jgi:outer membrane protein TolC
MTLNLRDGIGSDEAAELAVLLSPALRASRDRRGLATAQLIQAGVLPNPQVSYARDYVTGGNTADTVPAYSAGAAWEVTSLLPLLPKLSAARANRRSVDLDIAWDEWQAAENARLAVYRVIALEAQLVSAREADRALEESVIPLRKAVATHEKTVLDLAAAEATSQDAHATALALEGDFAKQQLALKKALGLPPNATVRIRAGIGLPSRLNVPTEEKLDDGVERCRLDLLALRQGYQSQDATVRAAILTAFPKIALGFTKASDTSDVHTTGFSITVDLPFFDRNQGTLATERATRQKLLDEYNNRVFEAHSDIATALSDIRSLNRQIAAAEEALPLLERLVTSAQAAAAQHNVDVLSYYIARTNLLQKRTQLLKLKQQLLETLTALELASGRFLPMKSTR